tara:strand:+ start:6042 stop:6368 length:327 start_codon:yes stop_codon:yes gene_type:complete
MNDPYIRTKDEQWKQREKSLVNTDPIFKHTPKKGGVKSKGYDPLTAEIKKRGKPADNQNAIFIFDGKEKEPTQKELIAKRKKLQHKKTEALNKKQYRDRLRTKWDRSW